MREAAFEFALARSDFAPSFAERLIAVARGAIAGLTRRRRAVGDLAGCAGWSPVSSPISA